MFLLLTTNQESGVNTGDMSARILIIEGVVQGVGFRRFVERVARRFSVYGSVQNLNDGTVKIMAQAGFDSLDNFEREIKNAPEPIVVDLIRAKETRVSPRLKQFSIVTGPLAKEMLEGFGAIESQFREYREEFRMFAHTTDHNFNALDSKYGEISAKLTEILDELRTENREAIKSLDRSVEALLRAIDKLPFQK